MVGDELKHRVVETQFGRETGIDPKQIAVALEQSVSLQTAWRQFVNGDVTTKVTRHSELLQILYSLTVFALKQQNPAAPSSQKPPVDAVKKLTVKMAMKLPKENGKWVLDKAYFEEKFCGALCALQHDDELEQQSGAHSDGMLNGPQCPGPSDFKPCALCTE